MTEEYFLTKLAENPWGWGVVVLAILYFEFRVFEVWVEIMATNQAIATKVAVTAAELAAVPRPKSLGSFFTRFLRRTPAALLILAVILTACAGGCSSLDGVRRNAPELRRSWLMFRDASEPAPVVSRDAWISLGDAVTHNLEAVEHASDE